MLIIYFNIVNGNGTQKNIYTNTKPIISVCKTVRFTSLNGPFCILKPTVLQRQMACIR